MKTLQKFATSQKRATYIWLVVAIASLLAIVVPVHLKSKMSILHLLLAGPALFGFIAAPVYHGRAAVLNRMTDVRNVLVHWTYSPDVMPWIKQPQEALITNDGLYFCEELFTFRKYSNKLKSVKLGKHREHGILTLDFTFTVPRTRGGGFTDSFLQVPIPSGEKQTALNLIERLTYNR